MTNIKEKINQLKNFLSQHKKLVFWVGGGLIFLLLTFFFLVRPILNLKNYLLKGKATATAAQQAFKEKNLPLLKEKIREEQEILLASQKEFQKLRFLKIIPYVKGYYQNASLALAASVHLGNSAAAGLEAVTPYADLLGFDARPEGGSNTQERIAFLIKSSPDLAKKMKTIKKELDAAGEAIEQINPHFLPKEIKGQPIKEKFPSLKETVKNALVFVDGAPDFFENLPYFLGADESRLYLILSQNDAELRPSGGFITAYALLRVENGQFKPLFSSDIYDLDSQFNQKIPTPRPIKDYLPKVYYWNLRDMNLSPDFKVSMETFYKYYKTIPGIKEVDGIVAVDTQLLADLVAALGGVAVPGWGNFTSEPDERCFGCPQIIYQLEYLADKPVSELKSDRKAVIGPLMHSLVLNAMGAPSEKMKPLAEAVFKATLEKHLLFYFPDPQKQTVMEKLNLAGRLAPVDSDYFLLADTNFAGAKSNMFIEEIIEDKINCDEKGFIAHEVKVKYQNPSPASDCNLESGGLCLNGLYRDWFRFYVPKGSELIELKGSEVKPLSYEEEGKTVFEGFYGNKYPLHPQGGTAIVSLKYRTPIKCQSDKDYSLFLQKQAGAKNHLFKVSYQGETKEFYLDYDRRLTWH